MRLIDKIKKMGSLLILSTCCLTSCNFLDVVPPEQAGCLLYTSDAADE